MPTIDEQLRFFAVKVNEGSGCIFQPDTSAFSYVLTVKHNLQKEDGSIFSPEDVQVERYNLQGEIVKVHDVYCHAELDLAVLVVDYIGSEEYLLTYSIAKKYEKVRVFGYPTYLKKEQIHTTSIMCECDLERVPDVSFEIITNNPLYTFNNGAAKNVLGLSGSGIFLEEGDFLVLKGIFPRLNDAEGAHNKINGIHISCFQKFIDQLALPPMVPACLTSFEFYRNKAFNTVNPVITASISSHISNIVASGITPISISTQTKGKFCVPYSLDYQNKIINPKIWKAWLELLVYLDIDTENPKYSFGTFCRNIKLYHSEKCHIIDEFVAQFLQDQALISKINNNDIIAYSSAIIPDFKYLKKERIDKIVWNIYRQRSLDSSVRIDDPNTIKRFPCIHINHFAEKIAAIDTELAPKEIKEFIKLEIQNILNYGND